MGRLIVRWLLAAIYLAAGAFHLTWPGPFLRIIPGWVPFPQDVVLLTGIAEALGAVGLIQPFSPALRKAAGWGLAAYAICVWPANINHMLIDDGSNLGYHVPRMFAQPLIIWAALWSSGAIDWPRRATVGPVAGSALGRDAAGVPARSGDRPRCDPAVRSSAAQRAARRCGRLCLRSAGAGDLPGISKEWVGPEARQA